MSRASQVNVKNAGVLPRSNYADVLTEITRQGFCPFCEEHLMKHHRKPVLFKNKSWLVTENAWPYEDSKKHFLLIARAHLADAAQLSPQGWAHLGAAFKRLTKDYKLRGASLVMRSGDTRYTGATVQHLHAQVVMGSPRKEHSFPLHALIGFGTKKNSPAT